MAKRAKQIYDAFPTKKGALRLQNSLNLATGVGPASTACPHGAGAVVRRLRPAQDAGRLKWGVFVNKSCKTI